MKNIRSICVFCGSRPGADPRHLTAARSLGGQLAARDIRLIYGGGGIGVMGSLAQAVRDQGGAVTGIIPEFLTAYEVGHIEGSEVVVVESMHERKRKMFEMADAFVILPGGIGTLDEAIEITTWKQLQLHRKPIVFVNDGGYWDPFLDLIDRVVEGGFGHGKIRDLFTFVATQEDIFAAITAAPEPDEIVLTSHL